MAEPALVGAPFAATPKQLAAARLWHDPKVRVVTIGGAIRSGKTQAAGRLIPSALVQLPNFPLGAFGPISLDPHTRDECGRCPCRGIRRHRFLPGARMEYAGVSLRFVAVLIDAIILVVLILVLALFTGGWYSTTTENGVHAVGVNADSWPLLVFFGYYVVFEAVCGRTIGKRLVGLRVVNEDGDSISWGQSLGRNLLRVVDAFFFYFVAAISVWSSSKRQRLGDRAANTFVIYDRGDRRESARLAPVASAPQQHAATGDSANY
jgi:uncharacterized RDD family membrane protein YckC